MFAANISSSVRFAMERRRWQPPSPETWVRRRAKREAAVAAVKQSPDYHEIAGMIEPDPNDSTVTKRRWELQVQLWRKALRDDASFNSGQDIEDLWDPMSIDDVVIDDSVQWLCGFWADQTWSSYHVTRSGEHTFDVFTLRPTGDCIFTQGLIKATGAGVVWGANRYELHRSDTNALEWRAPRDEADKFFWCRI